ncbi:MAG: MoxR-like ATPase [Acidimicrobiales bacterium]|jgi:MoxR-like ATPase
MDDNQAAAAELEQVLFQVKRVIVGQDHMVERLLVALLARGHILLEGLPGVAKTLAVSTLAEAIGGSFVRLQFTPDLLPSDLIGTRIWRSSSESFDIEWGPVFSNLVLTDEINRAPAKVQSALLEAMAERQVSVGGETRPLPQPFLVLATQNPIESEGVYTLPEAQRDRFLMKVSVPYPSPAEEMEIVRRVGSSLPHVAQALDLVELQRLQSICDEVYVDTAVAQYAVDLVMATREPAQRGLPELEPLIEFGVSPRATLGLVAAGRALALLRGRGHVVPQDLFDVARDVLRHRLMLSYEALAKDLSADDILNRLLAIVPAATVSPRAHTNGAPLAASYAAPPPPPAYEASTELATPPHPGLTDTPLASIAAPAGIDRNLPPIPPPAVPTFEGLTPADQSTATQQPAPVAAPVLAED